MRTSGKTLATRLVQPDNWDVKVLDFTPVVSCFVREAIRVITQ